MVHPFPLDRMNNPLLLLYCRSACNVTGFRESEQFHRNPCRYRPCNWPGRTWSSMSCNLEEITHGPHPKQGRPAATHLSGLWAPLHLAEKVGPHLGPDSLLLGTLSQSAHQAKLMRSSHRDPLRDPAGPILHPRCTGVTGEILHLLSQQKRIPCWSTMTNR